MRPRTSTRVEELLEIENQAIQLERHQWSPAPLNQAFWLYHFGGKHEEHLLTGGRRSASRMPRCFILEKLPHNKIASAVNSCRKQTQHRVDSHSCMQMILCRRRYLLVTPTVQKFRTTSVRKAQIDLAGDLIALWKWTSKMLSIWKRFIFHVRTGLSEHDSRRENIAVQQCLCFGLKEFL